MAGRRKLTFAADVSAENVANQSVLETGKTHTLTMGECATLNGRVMIEGRPVPHAGNGVIPTIRVQVLLSGYSR